MAALEAACTFGAFLFYRTIKRLFNPRRVATTLIGAPAIISLGFLFWQAQLAASLHLDLP
jgi:hypothetical protein